MAKELDTGNGLSVSNTLRNPFRDNGRHLVAIARHRKREVLLPPLFGVVVMMLLRQIWCLCFRDYMCSTFPNTTRTPSFGWESTRPSASLEYFPCHGTFQCARLEVPLDWNRTNTNGGNTLRHESEESPKMAIAVIKIPAQVAVTDPRYGGMILINPGGPGGSGVRFLLKYGQNIHKVVDASVEPGAMDQNSHILTNKYFDLVSFDPRGVNHTTPGFSCFPSALSREVWEAEDNIIGLELDDSSTFNNLWARWRAVGTSCASMESSSKTTMDGEHIGRYLSTASVVRDMVEIIERHGEWREKTAQTLMQNTPCSKTMSTIPNRTAWQKGEEKLQYWGFSYGTFLGQSFSSMQPNRVHRVVLDGVVDADDYSRTGWSTNLNDEDKIFQLLADTCYEAGPDRCALYNIGGSSKILDNINEILEGIRSSPVATWDTNGPKVITYSQAVLAIFSEFYKPLNGFTNIARLLSNLAKGNGSDFAEPQIAYSHSSNPPGDDRRSTSTAVLCSDGNPIEDVSKESFQTYRSMLKNQSSLMGDNWSTIRLPCLFYNIRPKWRFSGPFGRQTAHPILFASQTLDPVTPLRNAFAASKLFPGSGVLEEKGVGHCTLSMPSVCTAKHIREYFQSGRLPEEGTRCETDVRPFWEKDPVKRHNDGDDDLRGHLRDLAQEFPL